jgi:PAS domain S-box-containing protein
VIEPGFERSYNMFNAGQLYIIRQPGDAQSAQEFEYLNRIGVKALVDIPLIVNGKWWGTMGFDDCLKTRNWSNAEIDALKVAGNVVSAAIERKLADAALRDSESRLRLAIESARIGIWDWDISSNTISWLDKVESIFGLAPGTFDGQYNTYLGLIHPQDIAGVQNAINAALAGEPEPYFIEHRIITPTGNVRWLEGKGEVYRNEQGQPTRSVPSWILPSARKTSWPSRPPIALRRQPSKPKT